MSIRTRFAPSPTGFLHIGGARTALFCWLYARRHLGRFILRIEDTDRARSTDDAVQAILDGMAWLGLDHDEGPFYQTQRFERYAEVRDQLLSAGHAYRCYCTKEALDAMRAEQMANKQKPRYDGRCRKLTEAAGGAGGSDAPRRDGTAPVVRFKTPTTGQTIVDDAVRGRVVFENAELDDLIIARSDGTPTYNFTVVVDDHDMQVTDVIRGDDHLNNTPRQINIFKALGAEPPRYAHLPMILGPDGAKLSKRHGAVSVMEYRNDGFLPEALLNYLVRLGWSHGDQEVFSREEMVALFDISDVNQSASAINPEKLLWLNQHYIKAADPDDLAAELGWHFERLGIDVADGPALADVVRCQQARAKTMVEMAENSRFFYEAFAGYDEKAAAKHLGADATPVLMRLRDALEGLATWDVTAVHGAVNGVAEALELKLGKVAQPLRVAVAFGPVSPPIDQTLALLGRETTLARIDRALEYRDAESVAPT
ncbi:MAG: glutamate--tRNA ligase [Gammaproteobacteria bacterium]